MSNRLHVFTHIHAHLKTISAWPLYLRRVICVCAVNCVQYAQTVKGNI